MNYKLSLHSHTSDFAHLIFTKPNKIGYLSSLLNILYSDYKKDTIKILGVSNFNNNSVYNKLVSVTNNLPEDYEVDYTFKDYFIKIVHQNKIIYFLKTDEIGTDKGHILIIGFKGKIIGRKLSKVLNEAHRQKCIIIANHPLHHFNIAYTLVQKIMKDNNEISLSESSLNAYKKDFNALEENPYFQEDWQKIKSFAKKNKMMLVSDSDAHFLNEIFRSYYETDKLNFKSPKKFKKSLKRALKKRLHLHAKAFGFSARYKHIFQVYLENFLIKIGLMKL
jgi:hypothetical protein